MHVGGVSFSTHELQLELAREASDPCPNIHRVRLWSIQNVFIWRRRISHKVGLQIQESEMVVKPKRNRSLLKQGSSVRQLIS